MPKYGKNRAMSYGDYYKNKSHGPDGTMEDMEEDAKESKPGFSISITTGTQYTKPMDKKLRQEALKRRMNRKVG